MFVPDHPSRRRPSLWHWHNSRHPPIMDFLLHWALLLAVNTGLNLVAGNNTFAGAVSYLVPD